jgi:hypothetical protein
MGLAAVPAQAAPTPTLVRIIDTSSWGSPVTPAPDPMGLTYDSVHNRLILTDSEVEEKVTENKVTYQPAYWHGANVFEVTLDGTMTRTANIATITDQLDPADTTGMTYLPNGNGFTDEPTDVAYNPAGNGTIYVSDDDRDLITVIQLGSNGVLDATDTRTQFTTRDMTGDGEGIGFGVVDGTPTLFIAAGEGPLPKEDPANPATAWSANQHRIHEIWKLTAGPNGVFDGPAIPAGVDPANWDSNGDDVMTHFDTCNPTDPLVTTSPCTSPINQHDPEDIAFDPVSGNLFIGSRDVPTDPNAPASGNVVVITEATVNGSVVDTYNLGDIKGLRPSGIAVAPASGNASERSIYLADRAADNNSDRLKNDGRIFEFQIGGVVNRGPVVTSPGAQSTAEGTAVNLLIDAVDTEGDPFTCSATGLPLGLTHSTAAGGCLVSGTVQYGASVGNPHSVKVTATDTAHNLSNFVSFTWTVNDTTPPAPPVVLNIIRHTTGVHLDWPDSPEVDLAGYNVSRSTSATGTFTKLNTTLLTASEFFDGNAPANANSFYKVTALDKVTPTANESTATLGTAHRSKITFVSRSVAKGSGMTMAIKRPADVAPGDVLLAAFSARGSGQVLPPAGWKLVSSVTRSASLTHQAIYSHTVISPLASEKTSYTFSFLGRTSSVGMIVAYRGAVEAVQKTGGQANPAATEITAPGTTPTAADSLQIAFFSIGTDTTIAPPEGMIERSEVLLGSGPLRVTMEASDVIVDAGSVGTRIATSEKSGDSIGQVVVLNPSA